MATPQIGAPVSFVPSLETVPNPTQNEQQSYTNK